MTGAARLAAALALLAARPASAAPTTDELLARLARASQKTETLAADFVQVSRVKLFKKELTSHGRLRFRRPHQLRWEYVDPDPSLLILDGSVATLRMPGAPAQRFDLDRDPTMRAVFDQLLLWLAPDSLDRVRGDYTALAGGSGPEATLTLSPKDGTKVAQAFRAIALRVDPDGFVRGLTLTEKSGDEKTIEFRRIERNARLPEDTFR